MEDLLEITEVALFLFRMLIQSVYWALEFESDL